MTNNENVAILLLQSNAGKKMCFCVCVTLGLLVAVGVVQHVSHGEEGVAEDIRRDRPVFGVDQEHALQQRHKLPPVSLLHVQVTGIRAQHQVHLHPHTNYTDSDANI